METSAHIDYLAVSIPSRKARKNLVENIPDIVRDKRSRISSGNMGYTNAILTDNGTLVMNNPDHPHMGTYVAYSGKAIASIYGNISDVLSYHINENHRISRIDLAVDVTDSGLSIKELAEQAKNGKCVTAAKSFTLIDNLDKRGDTLYVGSMKKRKKLMRVYDKAYEQNLDKDWIRIETQFMQPSGSVVARKVLSDMNNENGSFQAIMRGFADFPQSKIWQEIFSVDAIPVRVLQYGGLSNTRKWLLDTVCKVIAREVVDDENFARVLNEKIMDEIAKLELE